MIFYSSFAARRNFALRRSMLVQNATDAVVRDRQLLANMTDTAAPSRRAK